GRAGRCRGPAEPESALVPVSGPYIHSRGEPMENDMSATKALRARAPRRACDVAVVLDGAASQEQAAPSAPATGPGAGALPPAGWADGGRVPEVADLAALPPGRLASAKRQLVQVKGRVGAFIEANKRGHAALDALLAAVYRYVHRHRATPDLFAALA